MIAKFRFEDVYMVSGSAVLCGPLIEGEITTDSVVKLGDRTIGIYRMEMYRKFFQKVKKGDNVGIFLEKGSITKEQAREFMYCRTGKDLDVFDISEIRNEKLNQIGI